MATVESASALLSEREGSLAAFCQRWQISELALFGSALRTEFAPDSDIDLLVEFSPGADWSLFDHLRMEAELRAILGREVDLVSRRAVEGSPNSIRRRE